MLATDNSRTGIPNFIQVNYRNSRRCVITGSLGKEGTGKVLDELSMASILEMSEGSDSRRCIKSLLEKLMKSDPSDAKRAGYYNSRALDITKSRANNALSSLSSINLLPSLTFTAIALDDHTWSFTIFMGTRKLNLLLVIVSDTNVANFFLVLFSFLLWVSC